MSSPKRDRLLNLVRTLPNEKASFYQKWIDEEDGKVTMKVDPMLSTMALSPPHLVLRERNAEGVYLYTVNPAPSNKPKEPPHKEKSVTIKTTSTVFFHGKPISLEEFKDLERAFKRLIA